MSKCLTYHSENSALISNAYLHDTGMNIIITVNFSPFFHLFIVIIFCQINSKPRLRDLIHGPWYSY